MLIFADKDKVNQVLMRSSDLSFFVAVLNKEKVYTRFLFLFFLFLNEKVKVFLLS